MTDNTEKYKDYIQHTIIGYLKRMMDGGKQHYETGNCVSPVNCITKDSVYKSVLHTNMNPSMAWMFCQRRRYIRAEAESF